MQMLKGFMVVDSRIDNTADTVAPIGELSPIARTYSRRKTTHHNPDIADVRYILFSSTLDERIIDESEIDETVVDSALILGKWVEDYVRNNLTVPDPSVIVSAISEAFPDYSEIIAGEHVNVEGDWYPSFIRYSHIDKDYTQKIWFSDSHFREEYDEYEIVVLHPIDSLDLMLSPYSEFNTELEKYTYSVQLDRLSVISKEHPYTLSRSQVYAWFDQDDFDLTLEVSWTVAIYGLAGDNLERIQNEIVETVRDETSGTDEQWQIAVPDLFSPTEFMLVPFWERLAIPDGDILSGIYSPITTHVYQGEVADIVLSHFDQDFLKSNMEVTSVVYRSMAILSIGQSTNRGDNYKLTDIFPDYILVGTTSSDFARMSPKTQEWVILIHDMLYVADNYIYEDTVPPNMVIVERNSVRYVLSQYDGAQYLVGERTSVIDKLKTGN